MNLSWIEDFLVLVEEGSFSKAARRRNISQPAFSRRIARLEAWLGVDLVKRQSQGIKLTPSAYRFEARMRQLLTSAQKLRNQIRADAFGDTKITIAMQHTLMITHLPTLLQQLQSHNLASTEALHVKAGNFDQCVAKLSNGQADLMLCFKPQGDSLVPYPIEAKSQCLGQEYLFPVAVPAIRSELVLGRESHRLVKLINYPRDSALGRIVRRFCLSSLIQNYTAETVCESAFTAGIKEMVLLGKGMGWLPKTLVQKELDAGVLQPLDDILNVAPLDIYIYRSQKNCNPFIEQMWPLFDTYAKAFFS